ncbi:unnamed protein product [Trichobilharzia regenti]|nr:unnamed protein product [Trichobilharzia regenti]
MFFLFSFFIYLLFQDPDASAAEFDYLSGFDLDLHFVGEAGDETKRRIAQATDVSRQQSSSPAALKRASNPNAIIGSGPTSAKPEIEHMFRAPEKRAPPFLALSFTVLCLLPLLGLLIAVSLKKIYNNQFSVLYFNWYLVRHS